MKSKKILIAFAIVTIGLSSLVSTGVVLGAPEDVLTEEQKEARRPKVSATLPLKDDKYVNPQDLRNGFDVEIEETVDGKIVKKKVRQDGHYIRVTFKSAYGKIDTVTDKISNTGFTLTLKGESANLVDEKKEIYVSDATSSGERTIYIPVKDEWNEGSTYTATIPKELVYGMGDSHKVGNEEHAWQFTMDSTPKINKIITGSVGEGFDNNEYITIEGNGFRKGTEVRFRPVGDPKKRYEAYFETYSEDMKDVLKVYLPRGKDTLPVGMYDILINNGMGFESEHVYGVFSVVPKGDYVPDADNSKKKKDTQGKDIEVGEISKYTKASRDTLELSSKYTNRYSLNLDLDNLMGENVWSRYINYEGYISDTINVLNTHSKWVDATLYGVTLDRSSGNRNISIGIGRAEQTVVDSLKKKLKTVDIKSDFIQISGENYKLNSASIKIPFKNSGGDNLRVLRYDETDRRFNEVNFKVNKVDKAVEFTSMEKGIFVVVE